jgi:hypothetical protein
MGFTTLDSTHHELFDSWKPKTLDQLLELAHQRLAHALELDDILRSPQSRENLTEAQRNVRNCELDIYYSDAFKVIR